MDGTEKYAPIKYGQSSIQPARIFCGKETVFSNGARLGNLVTVSGVQGGNSIGFLDRLTDRRKMGDGLKMSDFGLGMS